MRPCLMHPQATQQEKYIVGLRKSLKMVLQSNIVGPNRTVYLTKIGSSPLVSPTKITLSKERGKPGLIFHSSSFFPLHQLQTSIREVIKKKKKKNDGFNPTSPETPTNVDYVFTHGPQRWNRGSTDGLFLFLLLLLFLHTTNLAMTTWVH